MSDDLRATATPAVPQSPGEAAKAVTEDVRRLVRAEVELAKAEVAGQVAARGVAIGLLTIAGLLGLYVLYWLTYAIFAAWPDDLSGWAAALFTASVLLGGVIVLGGVGALILRRPMKSPERAQAAAKRTQEIVKDRFARG